MDSRPTLPAETGLAPAQEEAPAPVRRAKWRVWAGRLWTVIGLLVAAALGLAAGAAGPFIAREVVSLGGVPVPYGLALVLLATAGLFHVSGKLFGRLGAVVPVLTWAVPVVALLLPRPEGDIVLADDGYGLAFLLVGVVLAAWNLGRAISAPGRDDRRAPARP